MSSIRVNYITLMGMLSRGEVKKAEYVMILEGEDNESLLVELDNRGVLCFNHAGQLEDLPIDYYLLFSEDRYFKVQL